MGTAAERLGMTIQYCMPLPNHLLQSTSITAVTNVRASGDYQPGNANWRIGYSSLLLYSLGVIPFKDNFWTSETETGCKYMYCTEPNPQMVSVVATLSGGPVAFSDKIDLVNTTTVLRTCTKGGTLLKADKPATVLDAVFQTGRYWTPDGDMSEIEIWDSYSMFDNGRFMYHYLFAADLDAPFVVTTANLGLMGKQSVGFEFNDFISSRNYFVFNDQNNLTIPQLRSNKPQNYDAYLNKNFKKSQDDIKKEAIMQGRWRADAPPVQIGWRYYVIVPVLDNGWVLFGEFDKYVVASKNRFKEIKTGYEMNQQVAWIDIVLNGDEGEQVNLVLRAPNPGPLLQQTCTIGTLRKGALKCTQNVTNKSNPAACTC